MAAELRIRADELEWREVEGEVVVLDLRSSSYARINRAGAVLWNALAEGASLEKLAALLVARCGIDEATARRDAEAFVSSLGKRAWLNSSDPPSS